jgi:large subunit ribosomal protein L35
VAVFDAQALRGRRRPPRRSLKQDTKMPKMKTKSGAKKRFKMTATGRVKTGVAGKRHRLSSHKADYIRSHRGTKILQKGDEGLVKWYMPYNR